MKPFDERFADLVRDVFDVYQEPVDPSALAQIRQKLHRGRAPVFLMNWRVLAAASVLLITSATIWWNRPWVQTASTEIAGTGLVERTERMDRLDRLDPQYQNGQTAPVGPVSPTDQWERIPGSEQAENEERTGMTGLTDRSVPAEQMKQSEQAGQTAQAEQMQQKSIIPTHREMDPTVQPGEISRSVPAAIGVSDSPAGSQSSIRTEPPAEIDARSPSAIFNHPMAAAADPFGTVPSRHSSPGNSVGITAGSMVTYTSSQLAGGMGFFAGALHEWRLSGSLSLSTGGMLAWNRFDVEPAGQKRAEQNIVQILSTRVVSDAFVDVDMDVESRREYNLIALDVPLNMKWDVGGNSRGRYNLTMGLSSLIYLQQSFGEEGIHYSGHMVLDEGLGSYQVNIQSTQFSEREEVAAFTRFDFGRLLNISVGYSLYSAKNPLSFELYMKYPLGTLTSREITMGMGGISIRYSLGRN